ncbi:unnamed protein product [Pleuronectes platessa]|uniref:Uncharacterized protein n=1 Tax=Pleuronectes platessa TaxID=8262 RepID=A0A9N7ZFY1_PLEPL|nr:unnamed protein product [Pleuronectes platessa]
MPGSDSPKIIKRRRLQGDAPVSTTGAVSNKFAIMDSHCRKLATTCAQIGALAGLDHYLHNTHDSKWPRGSGKCVII